MRSPRTVPGRGLRGHVPDQLRHRGRLPAPAGRAPAAGRSGSQFTETAKGAGKALDGKTYGIPDGTDTRGLWFNKEIFAKAGLPADWQPKTWDDVLSAARTIKAAVPGVIPLNIYAGKAVGEVGLHAGLRDAALRHRRHPLRRRRPRSGSSAARASPTRCSSSRPSTTRGSARRRSRCSTRTGTTPSASSCCPQGKVGDQPGRLVDLAATGWTPVPRRGRSGARCWATRAMPTQHGPGARQGEHVRRLDLGDPAELRQPGQGLAARSRCWATASAS